jgi:hypothetical protein
MRYEMPSVTTLKIDDVLRQLGPARALMYMPGGGQGASGSGWSGSGWSGSGWSGSGKSKSHGGWS